MKVKRILRRIRWVSIGANRSFRALILWVEAGETKEVRKRRVWIVSGVALGSVALCVQTPSVFPTVVVVVLLGTFAWWGSHPHEQMVMVPSDFDSPVLVGGRPASVREVLKGYREMFPEESPAQIAARLSCLPGGEDITEQDVVTEFSRSGIRIEPDVEKAPKVTPEEEEGARKYDEAFRKTPTEAAAKFMRDRLTQRREAGDVRRDSRGTGEDSEGPVETQCVSTPPEEDPVNEASDSPESVQVDSRKE